ncbi:MAG TPA: hypothetical protein VFN10_04735 [Thermoanaerobaculia bacterium]|nr:hypothetical protein [Thermoanaerobaculia bacterium]
MKPLHLNLAARPYRDYRPVYAVVVVMSLLIAFLMLNNVDTYYRYVRDTKETRAKIASIEAQSDRERQRTQVVQTQLSHFDLSYLDRQTRFVNAKLAERAFSWSELLDQLETVLTNDVRITSISPGFADTGAIQLALQFESRRADGLIQTLDRMNASERFENAFPNSETLHEGGIYTFGIATTYWPLDRKAVQR